MKILLTGATGFLGSHLAKAFVENGHQVIALKRSGSRLDRLRDLQKEIQYYDLENLDLQRPFKENPAIGAVIHCATCYGRRGESGLEIFKANTEFPLRLLSNALRFNVDTFANTDTILSPALNAYSLSKSQFADWGRMLCHGNSTRFLNIRLEHMYGPGDDPSKFTTWIVRQCLQGVPEILLTPGDQKRDFVYVQDVISAYCKLLAHCADLERGFVQFEVGSGASVAMRYFIETVHKLTESTSRLEFGALPYREHEEMDACADISALGSVGWMPSVMLEEGLTNLIDYEKQAPTERSVQHD